MAVLFSQIAEAWGRPMVVQREERSVEALCRVAHPRCAFLVNEQAADEDRRVASHWQQYTERSWGYPRTYYRWKANVARELVGHPRVYNHEHKHLNVVFARPSLEMRRTCAGIGLSLSPAQAISAGLFEAATHEKT